MQSVSMCQYTVSDTSETSMGEEMVVDLAPVTWSSIAHCTVDCDVGFGICRGRVT